MKVLDKQMIKDEIETRTKQKKLKQIDEDNIADIKEIEDDLKYKERYRSNKKNV